MYMQDSNVNDVIIQTTIIAVVVAKKVLHGQLWYFHCTEFSTSNPKDHSNASQNCNCPPRTIWA